jgi:hypothetical protein
MNDGTNAWRGAATLTALSVLLVIALAGIAHMVPRPARLWIAMLFFPGFFIVIALSLRAFEGKLRSITDFRTSLTEGGEMFVAWGAVLIGVLAVTGAASLLLIP